MKIIQLHRKPLDPKTLVKRLTEPEHFSQLITAPAILQEDGETKVIFHRFDAMPVKIPYLLSGIKFGELERTAGLLSNSRTFGFMPRKVKHRDFCTSAKLNKESPGLMTMLRDPEKYGEHCELAEKILPDYRIGATPFTSGIINRNSQLKYHYDAGNFKGVASCMVAVTEGVEGGHLILPEYDVALQIDSGTLTIFDGQSILHGVSPINFKGLRSYRYTIVFYSLQQMWNCLPVDAELARIRAVKTTRERNRNDPNHPLRKDIHQNA